MKPLLCKILCVAVALLAGCSSQGVSTQPSAEGILDENLLHPEAWTHAILKSLVEDPSQVILLSQKVDQALLERIADESIQDDEPVLDDSERWQHQESVQFPLNAALQHCDKPTIVLTMGAVTHASMRYLKTYNFPREWSRSLSFRVDCSPTTIEVVMTDESPEPVPLITEWANSEEKLVEYRLGGWIELVAKRAVTLDENETDPDDATITNFKRAYLHILSTPELVEWFESGPCKTSTGENAVERTLTIRPFGVFMQNPQEGIRFFPDASDMYDGSYEKHGLGGIPLPSYVKKQMRKGQSTIFVGQRLSYQLTYGSESAGWSIRVRRVGEETQVSMFNRSTDDLVDE